MSSFPINNWKKTLDDVSKKIIFVVGTTASGKSEWALDLARKFDGVIFNCDSVQIYEDLNIGSAKPTPSERAMVPHFLYDIVKAPDVFTTGEYRRAFFQELEKISRPVFVVGGTGFYFQAIEKGMYPVGPSSPELRQKLEEEVKTESGSKKLYEELQSKDPESAQAISPQDHYRLVRAIELMRLEGKTRTQIKSEFEQNQQALPVFKVGILTEKELLEKRIEARTRNMLQLGLREEVKGLLNQGLQNWAPLSSVGYRETTSAIQNNWSDEKLYEQIVISTRQLSKKQRTWFKRDKDILWRTSKNHVSEVELSIEDYVLGKKKKGALTNFVKKID